MCNQRPVVQQRCVLRDEAVKPQLVASKRLHDLHITATTQRGKCVYGQSVVQQRCMLCSEAVKTTAGRHLEIP
jgi:hypothetical protein